MTSAIATTEPRNWSFYRTLKSESDGEYALKIHSESLMFSTCSAQTLGHYTQQQTGCSLASCGKLDTRDLSPHTPQKGEEMANAKERVLEGGILGIIAMKSNKVKRQGSW